MGRKQRRFAKPSRKKIETNPIELIMESELEPLPFQCDICMSHIAARKGKGRKIKHPEKNKCFEKSDDRPYPPLMNSKRVMNINCINFCHIKILRDR